MAEDVVAVAAVAVAANVAEDVVVVAADVAVAASVAVDVLVAAVVVAAGVAEDVAPAGGATLVAALARFERAGAAFEMRGTCVAACGKRMSPVRHANLINAWSPALFTCVSSQTTSTCATVKLYVPTK